MKRTTVVLYLILCGVTTAVGATYQWTDDKGVINYTDDLNSVPSKYRSTVKKRDDITTRDPKVRQELLEQERRARQDELNSPRIQPSPNVAPPTPTPPQFERPAPVPGETPPGRSKSERIRENIERRQIE
ncbi:DUF4124 domain-containing protein [Geobacter sp. SVR]|uniref:DUF4124 domain-containing protein n=1 Tax=Geobacter sp. SVR TaxID=2495594 RepID=UPI00143F0388|nr:DUF4124 domain-containing protein [Geobacter sp. SVR]BCS56020.1 hypothetical protein GSVR_43280 [Geobacter sp. SVR]GCF84783.1 hypothetical protein GSbR_13830 [Geobacter sp. SVR]